MNPENTGMRIVEMNVWMGGKKVLSVLWLTWVAS